MSSPACTCIRVRAAPAPGVCARALTAARPEGGRAAQNVHLILHPGGREGRLRLSLQGGFLVHTETGLLVHPLGGRGAMNVPLIYHPGGLNESRLRFEFIPKGLAGGGLAPRELIPVRSQPRELS
jgi:hypothetical protein